MFEKPGIAELRDAAHKLGMTPSDDYLAAVAQIVGPLAPFRSNTVCLGLTLIAADSFYPPHRHPEHLTSQTRRCQKAGPKGMNGGESRQYYAKTQEHDHDHEDAPQHLSLCSNAPCFEIVGTSIAYLAEITS